VKRRSPTRRVVAFLALAVAVAAQPQVMCGIHCLFVRDMAHTSAPGAFCHGQSVTTGHSASAPRLALAWLPADAPIGATGHPHAFVLAVSSAVPRSFAPPPECPPPRA